MCRKFSIHNSLNLVPALVGLLFCCFIGCSSSAKMGSSQSLSSQSDVRVDSAVSQRSVRLADLARQSTSSLHISLRYILYDTSLPVDSVTGRPPVRAEGEALVSQAACESVSLSDSAASQSAASVSVSAESSVTSDVKSSKSIRASPWLPRLLKFAVCAAILFLVLNCKGTIIRRIRTKISQLFPNWK
jgi:hypothetical protein